MSELGQAETGEANADQLPQLMAVIKEDQGQARTQALLAICDMSVAPINQVQFASAKLGLLPLLVEILRGDQGEARINALRVLRNVALAAANQVLLASTNLGLLPLLLEVIKSDKDAPRVEALGILLHMSGAAKNKVALGSVDLGLLPLLVEVIKEDRGEARIAAAATLANLALTKDNSVQIISAELGLLPLLVELMKENAADARTSAMAVFSTLSAAAANKVHLASTELGLLPVLVEVVREDRNTARTNALSIFWNLAVAVDNKVPLASAELGLLPVLLQVIREEKGETRKKAVGTIRCLCDAAENKVALASPDLGLLPVLVELLGEGKGAAALQAICALCSLSSEPQNQVPLASAELGLLPVLVALIRKRVGEMSKHALTVLKFLANPRQNRVFMAGAELGLLPLLVDFIKKDQDERDISFRLIVEMATEPENKALLVSADLSLLSTLVGLVREDKGEIRLRAVDALWKISALAKDEVLSSCGETDLVVAVLEVLREGDLVDKLAAAEALSESPKFARAGQLDLAQEGTTVLQEILCGETLRGYEEESVMASLWNFTEYFGVDCAAPMARSNIPQLVAQKLREAGPVVAAWETGDKYPYMLNYAMNLARHAAAVECMKSAGYLEIAYALLAHPENGCERLKAMYIIAFLTGKDEQSRHSASVAVEHPDIISQLVSVLENTLNGVGGEGYFHGTFVLRLTINACEVLSISDSNKELLVTSPLVSLLVRALRMFVNDDPPVGLCGGGGEDTETAELAVGTLLQLAFYYDSDAALQATYVIAANCDLVQILLGFISSEKASDTARDSARLLVKRLTVTEREENQAQGSAPPAEVQHPSQNGAGSRSAAPPAHIMLSYCWNATARPELVQQLHANLTTRGYDVWLDTAGSSLVPPMAGSTDERMAEAIEAAQVVIMCVSRIYKERPNCRMEAKYANQLYKKGKLQILYVMMQADYTTVSEPYCCDGWLGIQIGDALWYPLWEPGMVEATTDNLLSLIGDKCKLQGRRAPVATSAPATKEESLASPSMPAKLRTTVSEVAPAMELTREDLCKQAWEILSNPAKVLATADVSAYLEELGVVEAADLVDCDRDMLQALSAMLKPVPRKKFDKLLLDV